MKKQDIKLGKFYVVRRRGYRTIAKIVRRMPTQKMFFFSNHPPRQYLLVGGYDFAIGKQFEVLPQNALCEVTEQQAKDFAKTNGIKFDSCPEVKHYDENRKTSLF